MLEWKEKGKKTIYNFWDKNFKKLFNKIYNVEWKFNIPLYDGKFRITGIIDHITNTKNDNWGIIDWKTGKYKKPNEESEMQLSFYSVAIEKQFNKIPEWFCLHYIEHDKTNFSFRNKEKNKETEEQLIRFYNLIGDMQENDFKPNFKSCNRFCDFKNTCKYIIGEDGCGQIR
jgi:RecB family exonuclease